MSNHLWWYVARSGGIVAWALAAASVLLGLVLSGKPFGKRPRPNWVLDLHPYLGGLAVVFTAVHVTALVADSYTYFGPMQILVPWTSSYRPSAVAWGVVGMYLLLAIEITSLLRSRIPKRIWRRVHGASFALYATATIHGLYAGTDATGQALRIAMFATTAAVAVLTAFRVTQLATKPTPAPRVPARPTRSSRPPARQAPTARPTSVPRTPPRAARPNRPLHAAPRTPSRPRATSPSPRGELALR